MVVLHVFEGNYGRQRKYGWPNGCWLSFGNVVDDAKSFVVLLVVRGYPMGIPPIHLPQPVFGVDFGHNPCGTLDTDAASAVWEISKCNAVKRAKILLINVRAAFKAMRECTTRVLGSKFGIN